MKRTAQVCCGSLYFKFLGQESLWEAFGKTIKSQNKLTAALFLKQDDVKLTLIINQCLI